MKKLVIRISLILLIVLIIAAPYLIFRYSGKHAGLVLMIWLLITVSYIFVKKEKRD